VVLDKRIKTWNFFFWENGKRRSKKIGTMSQFPHKGIRVASSKTAPRCSRKTSSGQP